MPTKFKHLDNTCELDSEDIHYNFYESNLKMEEELKSAMKCMTLEALTLKFSDYDFQILEEKPGKDWIFVKRRKGWMAAKWKTVKERKDESA